MQAICKSLNGGNCDQLFATINLVAQLLMIGALWVGFYYARKRKIPRHRSVQTTVVIANIFFILFIMITSLYSFVFASGSFSGTVPVLMMVHGMLGLVAELLGIYLILRMRTQLIPPRFRIKNFKLAMRSLLGLWSLIVVLGLGIFFFRYLVPRSTASAATLTPLDRLSRAATDLQIHADELKAAAERGNLPTTQRHGEHLVNLIEGNRGGDYGDLNKDGLLEDPGDGTGMLALLQQVRDQPGGNGTQAATLQEGLRGDLLRIVADVKTLYQVADLGRANSQVQEIATVSERAGKQGQGTVGQIAQAMGVTVAQLQVQMEPAPAGTKVTVNAKDFDFAPKKVTVKKGAIVVWANGDPAKHTVTADDKHFNSKDIIPGANFSMTFTDTGTFPYYCEYHGDKGGVDMSGVITVEP